MVVGFCPEYDVKLFLFYLLPDEILGDKADGRMMHIVKQAGVFPEQGNAGFFVWWGKRMNDTSFAPTIENDNAIHSEGPKWLWIYILNSRAETQRRREPKT